MIKQLLQGMVVGIANIIPGVSGGTMMVAMGLYDKLIHAITHLRREFKDSLKLLVPILIGAGLALVIFANIIEFSLDNYPIQTNLLFCGLIVGSLPVIVKKTQKGSVSIGMLLSFLVFFALVVGMAFMGETSGNAADISFSVINVVKLLGTGVVASATMVVPGVSGSMMLMLMGYYEPIIKTINEFMEALVKLDINALFKAAGVLVPFGIGVVFGIFAIAKIIEYIFNYAERHAYFAIMGLIVASPIAILWKTDWKDFSILAVFTGAVALVLGWITARKLGEE